jgi:hypothetical protein
MLFAAFALYIPKAVEEIANPLLGVSVAVSPWVLEFATKRDATTNAIFVGVLSHCLQSGLRNSATT